AFLRLAATGKPRGGDDGVVGFEHGGVVAGRQRGQGEPRGGTPRGGDAAVVGQGHFAGTPVDAHAHTLFLGAGHGDVQFGHGVVVPALPADLLRGLRVLDADPADDLLA